MNDHKIIETINQQITTNKHYNNNINLYNNIQQKRKAKKRLRSIINQNEDIIDHLLNNNMMNKLKFIESKINDILPYAAITAYDITQFQ